MPSGRMDCTEALNSDLQTRMNGDFQLKKSRKGARGVRKVKTGCLTCKHKKCDERMPSCSPCTSTGRKCDYQSLISQDILNPKEKSIIDPKTNHLSIISLNATDSAHFDYFANICTKEFSLYFESPTWEGIVIQAAYTEPCIRHAALAIGALSRNNYHSQYKPSSQETLKYSMRQYNLALRALNNALDDNNINDGNKDESVRNWELAVLASVVFIAFEVLWGVDTRVRTHIDAAFAMLESLLNSSNSSSSSNRGGDLGYLVDALLQLGGQVSSFGMLDSQNQGGEWDVLRCRL